MLQTNSGMGLVETMKEKVVDDELDAWLDENITAEITVTSNDKTEIDKLEKRRQEDRGKFLEEIGVDMDLINYKGKIGEMQKNYDLSRAINIAENQLNNNPNSKIGSIPQVPANAILAELKKHGVAAKQSTPLSEIIAKN